MPFIDDLLNSVTMYKVVLYGLWALTGVALLFGLLGLLPFAFLALICSLVLILSTSYLFNQLFAKLFSVPANIESVWITGLILFLILVPAATAYEVFGVVLITLIAIASKYVLAMEKKHIFNPAAIALVVMGLAGSDLAIWWIGNDIMWPIVAIVGLLIVRKIRRMQMFFVFLLSSLIMIVLVGLRTGVSLPESLLQGLVSWPLLFFGTIMLTEPLTTPTTHTNQLFYGVIVGIITGSQVHIGNVFSTPELALVVGNVFSYLVSAKQKLVVTLQEKKAIATSTYDFSFKTPEKLRFQPGQYVEWTLGHAHPDNRGIRRYFTVASSPTEATLHLGIKVFPNGSTFKQALMAMKPGDDMIVGQVSGEFLLPSDTKKKLVLIADGIGVTPFRSQIQYLIDSGEKRDVIVLYACAGADDFVYQDVFNQAQKAFGLQVYYIVTDAKHVPAHWSGKCGYIDEKMVQELVPDYADRTFYISGPGGMVTAYKGLLRRMHVSLSSIKTDYFPGF